MHAERARARVVGVIISADNSSLVTRYAPRKIVIKIRVLLRSKSRFGTKVLAVAKYIVPRGSPYHSFFTAAK